MDNIQLQKLLQVHFPTAEEIYVEGAGGKFGVRIISADFSGLSAIKRQQRVYAVIGKLITAGSVHAVSMRLLTPQEHSTK